MAHHHHPHRDPDHPLLRLLRLHASRMLTFLLCFAFHTCYTCLYFKSFFTFFILPTATGGSDRQREKNKSSDFYDFCKLSTVTVFHLQLFLYLIAGGVDLQNCRRWKITIVAWKTILKVLLLFLTIPDCRRRWPTKLSALENTDIYFCQKILSFGSEWVSPKEFVYFLSGFLEVLIYQYICLSTFEHFWKASSVLIALQYFQLSSKEHFFENFKLIFLSVSVSLSLLLFA